MKLPTLEEIKKTIGQTWFTEDGCDSSLISLSTRDHGDVGNEEPGSRDISEAKRIIKILREAYPHLFIDGDTCDEWVSVEIRLTK
jgi:hypothetical protein